MLRAQPSTRGVSTPPARAIAILLLAAVVWMRPSPALAAEDSRSQVQAGNKGLIGMGLIGAELGLAVPALAGLDATWSLVVFPVVGAVGGGVGGHYLFDRPNRRGGAIAMLGIGLALAIPAIVVTRAALAFDPYEDGVEVIAETDRDRSARLAAEAGPGLLRFGGGSVFLRVPSVDVVPAGMASSGRPSFEVPLRTEVHVALLSGAF